MASADHDLHLEDVPSGHAGIYQLEKHLPTVEPKAARQIGHTWSKEYLCQVVCHSTETSRKRFVSVVSVVSVVGAVGVVSVVSLIN